MNKFIFAFALVACAAVAASAQLEEPSQLALFENDDVEVGHLSADRALFKDFCLAARDDVRAYLKSSMGEGSTQLFNSIAEVVGTVTKSIADAYNQAVQENGANISAGDLSLTKAVMVMSSAVSGSTKSKVSEQLANLKAMLTSENLQEIADQACVKVGVYLKPQIEKKLNAYKRDLLNSPEAAQFEEVIKGTKLNNVGCVTTSRLSKIATGCNFLRTMAPMMFEFMGY